MTDLAPPLRELRGQCREAGRLLRAFALEVDADPDAMADHLDSPTLALVRAAGMPKEYRAADAPDLAGYSDGCLARAVAGVELARGDAGALVGNTGPSLAGLAVDSLGSPEQRELFYESIADGRTWTFFGMTEPEHGSDATAMRSRLDPVGDPADGYRLTGAKRYVSNGARAAVGVAFARIGSTPLSVRGVLLRLPAAGYRAEPLDMMGLRAARIARIELEGVHVPREMLLGAHLPASRRGLWGAGRAFNAMRVQIAALALGTALAARDYVAEQRPGWPGHELAAARLEAATELLYDCAAAVDLDPDTRVHPSTVKLHATDLAVRTVRWAARALGPGALLEHRLLEKWSRDVHAFEFMDGTSNILRLAITQDVTTRRARP